MAVPDFQTIMLPLLEAVADGNVHRLSDLVDRLAERLRLSPDDRTQLIQSGRRRLFDHRVWWARTYLVQAGALETTTRGTVRITARGKALLAEKPARITTRLLTRYPEFMAFRQRSRTGAIGPSNVSRTVEALEPGEPTETPEEAIDRAHQELQAALADEVLARIKGRSARFFEKLVLDLLVAMGYGGSFTDAAQVIGQSGDGGIDGVIKEDKLGLDMLYVQAKRWDNTVGRPEVQGFAGSLEGYRARKGVFITTSSFSREAREYVDRIDKRIVLIDGSTLARLLVEHNVGVAVASSLQIKRIDSDYFTEE